MSDRRDNGPPRLPPERDVTPQLRARVLNEATRADRKPSRAPTRVGPILAGLAAAAVVIGIVYSVSQNGDGQTPATRHDTAGTPVDPHTADETVARVVPKDAVEPIQDSCRGAANVEAGFRMTTEKLHSPIGPIYVGAYAEKRSPDHTQIFCTPFATLTSTPEVNIVTSQTPVKLIAGSRVQGLLPARKEADRTVYYDGAWFAVSSGVQQIEVRLIVDDVPQTWHSATRHHSFLFASTWAPLTDDELDSDVTVEYRAISFDDTLMAVPSSVSSSTVTPAETGRLNSQRTVFPPIAD